VTKVIFCEFRPDKLPLAKEVSPPQAHIPCSLRSEGLQVQSTLNSIH